MSHSKQKSDYVPVLIDEAALARLEQAGSKLRLPSNDLSYTRAQQLMVLLPLLDLLIEHGLEPQFAVKIGGKLV